MFRGPGEGLGSSRRHAGFVYTYSVTSPDSGTSPLIPRTQTPHFWMFLISSYDFVVFVFLFLELPIDKQAHPDSDQYLCVSCWTTKVKSLFVLRLTALSIWSYLGTMKSSWHDVWAGSFLQVSQRCLSLRGPCQISCSTFMRDIAFFTWLFNLMWCCS